MSYSKNAYQDLYKVILSFKNPFCFDYYPGYFIVEEITSTNHTHFKIMIYSVICLYRNF